MPGVTKTRTIREAREKNDVAVRPVLDADTALMRRRSFGSMTKFTIGDMVTMHAQLSAYSDLVGVVVEISADPDDSMPYIVDLGEDSGRHRFGPDELKVATMGERLNSLIRVHGDSA